MLVVCKTGREILSVRNIMVIYPRYCEGKHKDSPDCTKSNFISIYSEYAVFFQEPLPLLTKQRQWRRSQQDVHPALVFAFDQSVSPIRYSHMCRNGGAR